MANIRDLLFKYLQELCNNNYTYSLVISSQGRDDSSKAYGLLYQRRYDVALSICAPTPPPITPLDSALPGQKGKYIKILLNKLKMLMSVSL